jgi:acyl-coenzyme A synthetase/AMP-(fatty) acid ligase
MLNRPRVLLDRRMTAANALDTARGAHPDSVVMHLTSPTELTGLPADGELTAMHLTCWIDRVARLLLDAGLARGDRVGIYLTNGPEYWLLGMAVIRAGGVAVPVNSGMALDAVRRHLEAAGASMLFADAAHMAKIGGADDLPTIRIWLFPVVPAGFTGKGISINEGADAPPAAHFVPADLEPDDVVLLVHTSGTTGIPKLVPRTSGQVVTAVKRHYPDELIGHGNRTAIAGHFNHFVYYAGILSAVVGNLATWPIGDLRTEKIVEVIRDERITILFAFPDIYVRLYREGLDPAALASIRIWVTTADAFHEVHAEAFCRVGAYLRAGPVTLVPSIFVETFGTSEIGTAALRRIRMRWLPRRLDRSVGWPVLAGPRVRVANNAGRPARRGETGRLEVKGSTVFAGYWDPEDILIHEAPVDGWWWTGDVARRGIAGGISQLGRAVDVIETDAGPLYGLAVEEVLLTHPDVADTVVVSMADEDGRSTPVALVTPRLGTDLDAESFRSWAKAQPGVPDALDRFRVVTFDELPRGLTGKILRRPDRWARRHRGRSAELHSRAVTTSAAVAATKPTTETTVRTHCASIQCLSVVTISVSSSLPTVARSAFA